MCAHVYLSLGFALGLLQGVLLTSSLVFELWSTRVATFYRYTCVLRPPALGSSFLCCGPPLLLLLFVYLFQPKNGLWCFMDYKT